MPAQRQLNGACVVVLDRDADDVGGQRLHRLQEGLVDAEMNHRHVREQAGTMAKQEIERDLGPRRRSSPADGWRIFRPSTWRRFVRMPDRRSAADPETPQRTRRFDAPNSRALPATHGRFRCWRGAGDCWRKAPGRSGSVQPSPMVRPGNSTQPRAKRGSTMSRIGGMPRLRARPPGDRPARERGARVAPH